MIPEEINIAIAEVCGRVRRHDGLWYPRGKMVGSARIPNYYSDLNEIIKAIKWVSSNHEDWCWGTFGITMNNILGIAHHEFNWDYVIKTEDSQYCEGFLRVFDKWKEV